MNLKIAIFPGSFDPIHDGHIDVIKRASCLFDKLYVAVSINVSKTSLSLDIRYKTAKITIDELKLSNVEVIANDGLVIDIAKKNNCKYIVRSLRDFKDYQLETDMAKINHALDEGIETVLFIANAQLKSLSSSNLKALKNNVDIFLK